MMAYASYLLTNRVMSEEDKNELEALLIPFGIQLLTHKERTYRPLSNGAHRTARIPKVVEAAGTGAMVEEFGCLPARSTFGHESDFAHSKQVRTCGLLVRDGRVGVGLRDGQAARLSPEG